VNARGTFQIRRAILDDLPRLKELWQVGRISIPDLDKRFTEFQVAVNDRGEVVAAVGLQLTGTDGKIHSETFSDFALSDAVRPLLWERLQVVARNHGLYRFWTDEVAPFWKKDAGFSTPTAEGLSRLPEVFGPAHGGWLALRLRDESSDPDLLEAQFKMFREAERAKRERLVQWADFMKKAGTVLAGLLLIFALAVLFYYGRHWFGRPRQ
jgi:hypothetical protein